MYKWEINYRFCYFMFLNGNCSFAPLPTRHQTSTLHIWSNAIKVDICTNFVIKFANRTFHPVLNFRNTFK